MHRATCGTCRVVFSTPSRRRSFCSPRCYHASPTRRLPRTDKPKQSRVQRATGHPIAPPSGFVAVCRLVLYEKVGPGSHPCHWCGTTVEWLPGHGTIKGALIADHLDWNIHNNSPENLVPSCNDCNAHRLSGPREKRIKPGELFVTNANGSRSRAMKQTCADCGTEFVARIAQIKIGRGLFCSRSCARRQPRH